MLIAEDDTLRGVQSRETGLPAFGLPVDRETDSTHHEDHDEDHDDQIIMIFERETGRRFRADERSLLAEFRRHDLQLIEASIRHAVKYARDPVGSFSYCAKVIRQRSAKPAPEPAPSSEHRVPERSADRSGANQPATADLRMMVLRIWESNRRRPGYTRDELLRDVTAAVIATNSETSDDDIAAAVSAIIP